MAYKSWRFESKYSSASTDFKAEHLVLHNGEIPKAQNNQLVVKVHAAGLNPVDYKVGCFGFVPFPLTPGLDVAGVVTEVGPAVTKFKVGDRVYYMGNLKETYGAFGTYSVTEETTVTKIPDDVTFEQAAAIPTAGWTAYVALHEKARVRPGESVVITAASGGVGGYAVQLAKLAGLEVIATCSAKNFEHVKKLGADHVIDYTSEDIEARVKQITNGRGVDVWVDVIGSDSANVGLKCLAFGGSVIAIQGNPTTPIGECFSKQQSIQDVFIGGAHNADIRAKQTLARVGHEMVTLVQQKKIDPLLKETITFDQIPAALVRIKDRHVVGKIVAKFD